MSTRSKSCCHLMCRRDNNNNNKKQPRFEYSDPVASSVHIALIAQIRCRGVHTSFRLQFSSSIQSRDILLFGPIELMMRNDKCERTLDGMNCRQTTNPRWRTCFNQSANVYRMCTLLATGSCDSNCRLIFMRRQKKKKIGQKESRKTTVYQRVAA